LSLVSFVVSCTTGVGVYDGMLQNNANKRIC
jgi:hypothetical protein